MPNLSLHVNGENRTVELRDPDEPLLYVLRNALRLTGAKFGCGLGQCGACTVLVDGEAVRSCTMPVSKAAGQESSRSKGSARRTSRIRCRRRSSPSRRRNAATASPAW